MIKKELDALFKLPGGKKFETRLNILAEKYKDDPAAKKEIAAFIKKGVARSAKRIEAIEAEINVRQQIDHVTAIINLSFVAKKYFGKTRHWLYQRINNNIVDGKTRRFTRDELDTLNMAFKDMGKIIGSVNIH